MLVEFYYLVSKRRRLINTRITVDLLATLLVLTAFEFTTFARNINGSGMTGDQNGEGEGMPWTGVMVNAGPPYTQNPGD